MVRGACSYERGKPFIRVIMLGYHACMYRMQYEGYYAGMYHTLHTGVPCSTAVLGVPQYRGLR